MYTTEQSHWTDKYNNRSYASPINYSLSKQKTKDKQSETEKFAKKITSLLNEQAFQQE